MGFIFINSHFHFIIFSIISTLFSENVNLHSGLSHLDISKDKLQNKVRQNLFLPQFDSMPKEFDVDLYDFDPDNELH